MQESFELLYWKDVKDKILALNPAFGQAIDQIKNIDEFRVMVARYPFGASIVKNGVFHIYYKNEYLAITDPKLPPEVLNHLKYTWRCIPFGIVSHNNIEWYIDLPSHIIPNKVFSPGNLVSLLTIFDPQQYSNMISSLHSIQSGSRSLILLPKIAHAAYNERLQKRFKVKRQNLCPKTLAQQWPLFNDIANSKKFEHPWHSELIIFPKRFMEAIEDTPSLKIQLLSQAWNAHSFLRNKLPFDLIWSLFVDEHLSLAQKNTPFITETAKHLIRVAICETPAYTPAVDNQSAPLSGLLDAFLEVYKIRYYLPIFMQIQYYDGINPVYYSLHKHTFLHPIPEKNSANQTIREINTIKRVIELFTELVIENKLMFDLKDTVLYQTLNLVEFDFFHPFGEEVRSDIASIPKEDPRFLSAVNKCDIDKDLSFPDHSIFFNGCIRIRPKSTS